MSISLRVKKYFIATYLWSPAMTELASCSHGQADGDADRLLPSRALHPRGHDPRPGAGHDHPPPPGQVGGDPAGLVVDRVVRPGAGRAEDRHLGHVVVGREDAEGVAHLGQRRGGDLEVQPLDVVGGQGHGGGQQLPRHPGVGLGSDGREQTVDLVLELGRGRRAGSHRGSSGSRRQPTGAARAAGGPAPAAMLNDRETLPGRPPTEAHRAVPWASWSDHGCREGGREPARSARHAAPAGRHHRRAGLPGRGPGRGAARSRGSGATARARSWRWGSGRSTTSPAG